ncbi:universal stress protein [Alloyangia pacifica]|uniref:Universal stress protein n=1 Tax=Alloyangia pacifica TaxID=311180 RepID=A0A2U8H8L7_9RHOB|nr:MULTISPECIES: universal stress protein [Roseobacteraceae]AWI82242.1 universal stress protein [Alloyangia pacifica]NDW32105.1 universal stress protein [Salipiger sp. PrR007]
MATETFVVAYENKEGDDGLLDYAIARAKKDDAALLLVHILEWSPYKFLTPQEIEERHARRKQEMARAREVMLDPALAKVHAAGLEGDCRIRYGSVVELVAEIASEAGASMIFVGRSGTQSMAARIFGSVPLGLAQVAPVPTVIVP